MELKAQDVLVALKLVALENRPWSYAELAVSLGMSVSQVHAAVKRGVQAGLLVRGEQRIRVNSRNLSEFLAHGLKYVFVPERGALVRGMPTRYAAPPLVAHFMADDEPPPVWPDPAGEVRGQSFSPLYKLAPGAARRDPLLYELLVLVDAIRGGQARERDVAIKRLQQTLKNYDARTKS